MRRTSILILAALLLHPALASAQRFGLWANGTQLKLVRHDVSVTINHPVAETVVTQEFQNPHPYNVETYFYYPVPSGAKVTGMALWVPKVGRREARMLERQKAREIYNGIVREKRDPALLERVDGNTFRIRIFPVLARTRQRVELRFVQPVAREGRGNYRFTLRRPPGAVIHALRLGLSLTAPDGVRSARLDGYSGSARQQGGALAWPLPTARRSFDQDIHLRYNTGVLPRPAVATVKHGSRRLFVAEVPLQRATAAVRRVVVLVDTSRSMKTHARAARAVARQLLERARPADLLAVWPFDLLPRQGAPLTRADQLSRDLLLRHLQDSPHQLGTAYAPAVRKALAAGARHIVLVTDGASRFHAAELEHVQRLLFDTRSVALSVVTMPTAENGAQLSELASMTGGKYHQLLSAAPSPGLARQLLQVTPGQDVALSGGGAVHVVSREPDRLLVAGALPAGHTTNTVQLRLTRSGRKVTLALPADAPAVHGVRGIWAGAAIASAMRQVKLFGESDALRQRVVGLSKAHNVLSEYTALLATETDKDYQRKTSGRKWQRKVPSVADDLPANGGGFGSSPEPHEWALMLVMLALMLWSKRRSLRGFAGRIRLPLRPT